MLFRFSRIVAAALPAVAALVLLLVAGVGTTDADPLPSSIRERPPNPAAIAPDGAVGARRLFATRPGAGCSSWQPSSVVCVLHAVAAGDTVTPTATQTPRPMTGGRETMMGARMDPPSLPPVPTAVTSYYDPAQRDSGGALYEQRCSTCHGDVGQGLTPEWRAEWPEKEQNCWQSKCHAANHPPDGFRLPKYVPPVIGETALLRFQTGDDLYTYIHDWMPYHAPGILTDEEYWAITAFLLDAQGAPADGAVLGPGGAAHIALRPEPAAPSRPGWPLPAAAGVTLTSLAAFVLWRRRR